MFEMKNNNTALSLIISFAVILIFGPVEVAAEYSDLAAARQASALSGKKILMEFYRESCEFCHKANEEFVSNPEIIAALKDVEHLKLNAREGEGYELAPKYEIGYSFPVFILCDSTGDVYYRWIGYTDARSFLIQFKQAQLQTMTVDQRVSSQRDNPTFESAIFLARYFEEALAYLKAVKYYREAEKLSGQAHRNYSYQIFSNLASASWNDQARFDEVVPAADTILKIARPYDVVRMASSLTNLARKVGRLEDVKNYLETGIHTAKAHRDADNIARYYPNLLADYALHFSHDTASAMKIKQSTYGDNWQNNPVHCFQFAKWCLDRKINLEQAEQLARSAVGGMKEGYYRGRVYSTIAEICHYRGNQDQAIEMLQAAIQQEPENDYYWDMLKQYQSENK